MTTLNSHLHNCRCLLHYWYAACSVLLLCCVAALLLCCLWSSAASEARLVLRLRITCCSAAPAAPAASAPSAPSAVWYNLMWCGAVHGMVWCCVVWCMVFKHGLLELAWKLSKCDFVQKRVFTKTNKKHCSLLLLASNMGRKMASDASLYALGALLGCSWNTRAALVGVPFPPWKPQPRKC